MKTVTLEIPDELATRLETECAALGIREQERILQALELNVAPANNLKPGWLPERLKALEAYLRKVPGIRRTAVSKADSPRWWIKFSIDLKSKFAWQVVQELGFVLN